jgi:exodeoxyribonuclease V gamma subunit
VVVGRGRDDVAAARVAGLDAPLALDYLATLVDLYDRGMREPLPLSSEASAAYVQGGVAAADKAWTSTFDYPKEDRQPEHKLVHGGEIPLSDLLATTPRSDENWYPDEASRFGAYARRLWDGLLAREVLEDP